jgi:hypothetical protein
MKRILVFTALLFCGMSVSAQTPKYTTEILNDGTLCIICPSENDALLLLNGNYNLPETCVIAVLLKGIYLTNDNPLIPKEYSMLNGTKLVSGNGGPLGGAVTVFYNLNRNTEYYVFWKREYNETSTRIAMLHGNGKPVYSSIIFGISDKDFNPLTPIKK